MKKIILMAIGTVTLILGFIGVFLPVIPTTPFVLISLACFVNTSEKMHHFVMTNKYLGPYARAYASGEGIPKKAKFKAVFLIWITIGFSVTFILEPLPLRIMLLVIATIVSTYIFTRPTAQEPK
ncbi:MAG TPA: DUF454 domain-containing protein [Clostridiales bacterium UBA8960]|nr:DUF454 domain-containing protein [Clostridiales bacterium UBA8960]